MSITSIGSGASSSLTEDILGQIRGSQQGDEGFADIASQIVSNDDTDGDGLLSLEETPLNGDRFAEMDADGDGYLTAEELAADAQEKAESMRSMMGSLTMMMQGIMNGEAPSTDDIASSIVSNLDTDGDSALSFEESSLTEDVFNEMDADGDGLLTAEEIAAQAQETAEAMGGAGGTAETASSTSAEGSGSASASGGSSGSDEEEEFDEYDLNEDGEVTMDELFQALRSSNSSLFSQIFGSSGDDASSVSQYTQRLGMMAYAAQDLL